MTRGVWWRLFCAGVGYLCGNFLTAQLAAKIAAGKAPEEIGTGNPGMANIMANVGWRAGFAVLAGDLAKTVLACGLCALWTGRYIGRDTAVLYAGEGALLGHNFPFWKRGRGGKGVTVTCAWLILYLGPLGLACCALGGLTVFIWGYLPLGAVVIPAAAIPAALAQKSWEGIFWMCAAALMMYFRHRRGLSRILRDEETPVRFKMKHKKDGRGEER